MGEGGGGRGATRGCPRHPGSGCRTLKHCVGLEELCLAAGILVDCVHRKIRANWETRRHREVDADWSSGQSGWLPLAQRPEEENRDSLLLEAATMSLSPSRSQSFIIHSSENMKWKWEANSRQQTRDPILYLQYNGWPDQPITGSKFKVFEKFIGHLLHLTRWY